MSEKDLYNKISNQYRVLKLMDLYEDEFVKELGQKGYKAMIDEKLDELILWRSELNKIKNEKSN